MKELAKYLSDISKSGKKILILGHPHSDPDAVSSSLGLEKILESKGAEVEAGIPSNLSKLSRAVLERVGEEITVDPPVDADVVVVLDTSSMDQLKEYEKKIKDSAPEIIFIDHHHPDEETLDFIDKYYIDENTSSTVELILDIAQELEYSFDSKTAMLMLTGIISDTGHFKFANEQTFEAVSKLLKEGAGYQEALETLKTPEDESKKVAMLKAAQRLELYKSHGRWIAFSEIGAYESDAASLFVKIGADVSLVASSNNEIRMSARSKSGVAAETNLHLGELMSELADFFGGTGGGHAGAAAMNAEAKLDEVKNKALKEVKKMLSPVQPRSVN